MAEHILMLDIEGTLLISEDTPTIHKWDRINEIITYTKPDRIGLFSFIFHTQADVFGASHLISMFNDSWNIKIDRELIPTKELIYELIKTSGKETFFSRQQMCFMDFCELWSKDRAFIDWSRITQTGHIVLVDDMVCDCDLWYPECHIQMIHV